MKTDRMEVTPGGFRVLRNLLLKIESPPQPEETAPRRLLVIGVRNGATIAGIDHEFRYLITGIDENPESVLEAKAAINAGEKKIPAAIRHMQPLRMDFNDGSFDVVLCEGLLNRHPKQRLLGEIRRVLQPGGHLLATDSFWLKPDPPTFVRTIWELRESPLPMIDDWARIGHEAGFGMIALHDISGELASFYEQQRRLLERRNTGTDMDRQSRKLFKGFMHETDAFLRQGGSKWLGYAAFILQRV